MPRHTPLLALALVLGAACHDPVAGGDRRYHAPPNPQGVSILTQHVDNSRAGWNASETLLTTSNVDATHFGKLFTLSVDDQVYAQPLVAGKLAIADSAHNVVFVATVNNTLYAYDADDGTLYWQKNYTASGMRPPRNTDMAGACGGGYVDFSGNIGIVGTPVIDSTTKTIYFVTRSTTGSAFVQHLHAVDIVTGSERAGSPVKISATASGTGDGSVNGRITFDAQHQNQRQGLTLVNGVVYVTFSSHCDWGPYHGWILGYDAATLQQRTVWNSTPNGSNGGIWESGMGLAADAAGNLYGVVGNGTVGDSGSVSNVTNRGESALKLSPSGATMQVASWFTPYNYQELNDYDNDYGGMGAFLIPGSNLFLTGDKAGNLYLLDKDAMGGYQPTTNNVLEVVPLGGSANLHAQPAFYGGATKEFVYVWSENDALRAIPFLRANSYLDQTSTVFGPGTGPTGQNGAVLAVSSNGTTPGSAILWASYAASGDAEHTVSPGVLRAFDASDVTKELWNSHIDPNRDAVGSYAKFASPTIANGHVYLPTFSGAVVVYGER